MLRRLCALALLAAGPSLLYAQASRISPLGDPSVRADSIYKLAVDPAKFPEQDAAFLLDDGVLRFEADGRGTRTYRQIVQILRQSAVERYQEQSFSWSPAHERLTINWIRVVRPDGSVVSAKPAHVQESDVPASTDDPVYSDRRVRRVSLSGVAPGTIVDYSVTTEELKPFLPRDFFATWSVSTGLQVARSRYIIDLPATLTPRIRERNLSFKRVERVAGTRRVYTWATANVPKVKAEPLAADSNDVYQSILVSSPIEWSDIAKWSATLARPKMVMTPLVAARVDSVVHGARTRLDSIRAVHRWVAQDIRYVAIALGIGGYQPHTPEQVINTGFGDCKDKATLFVAALGKLGIEAYPVLLNSTGGVRRDMPSIQQLDHEIAAVREGNGWQFVDLTASSTPYGELPPDEQGEFALIVRPDGTSEVATLPIVPAAANHTVTRFTGTVDSTGVVAGHYEESSTGALQYSLRSLFYDPLDSLQRSKLADAFASKLFENAQGDSLIAFDGRDLQAPVTVRVKLAQGRAATVNGSTMILQMPFASMAGLAAAARDLETEEKRRFPIDPAKLWGRRSNDIEYLLTLPAGWHAELPKSVSTASPFGIYQSEYTQEGNVLRLVRHIEGTTGVRPPEAITDLIAWFRAVAADDAKQIVLTRDKT
jgi:transglutaminase-like putative cysteine protease